MSSEVTQDPSPTQHRVEVTLRRPWYGAFQRPTVVFDGRGQPAQWGTGSWQVGGTDVSFEVFLYNRIWRYGAARTTLTADVDTSLVYHAPLLPFLPGRFTTS
ncbi:hypothetical protein [Plantibacter sp. ME-Dv--P-122b]|uniref:hypothetical protein n=1 Tax=Plantibacter sp. ME-Dv--P-122b TaxID=3040300 RepID=UPI0025510BD5|nr:hypothetical protein [Plantibacter sp. ME-Dv--P-122b]